MSQIIKEGEAYEFDCQCDFCKNHRCLVDIEKSICVHYKCEGRGNNK